MNRVCFITNTIFFDLLRIPVIDLLGKSTPGFALSGGVGPERRAAAVTTLSFQMRRSASLQA